MSKNTVNIGSAIDLLLALITATQEISEIIAEARRDGRDVLSADEWQDILDSNDAAHDELRKAIEAA